MRSSSGATKLIADMKKRFSITMAVRDHRGNELDSWVVPPEGGTVQRNELHGNLEHWIGWTNYPAPYWNKWNWFARVEDEVYGAYTLWWYGQWIPHFMV